MRIQEINIEDINYPKQLLDLEDPPKKLYTLGNISLLNEESFSIVGTRYITDEGKKNCEEISKELALRDITLVSGMARGTDTLVHKTCLKYGGKTIAVLPCGFNRIYPKENIGLFQRIITQNGLALTEYPENEGAESSKFLARNRIVAAISKGTLVIEALVKSGTNRTSKIAFETKRKVFAIPRKYSKPLLYGDK